VARRLALAVTLVAALLPVAGAGGADAQTPKRGGTVVFGPIREPSCLATFLFVCRGSGVATPGHTWVAQTVLRPAFLADSKSRLRPTLVSGVSFTTKPPFTLTYRIRPEARWSDGVPITALDFVFTDKVIRRFNSEDAGEIHRQVRSVRVVDAKTVKVVLRTRVAGWQQGLFWTLLPRHALLGEKLADIWGDEIVNPKTGRRIGSGPFLVESWERGKQLTLVRNRQYWGSHTAYLDKVVIRFCREVCNAPPGAEVLERLGNGDVDFAFARDTTIVSDLRRLPRVEVLASYSDGWEHFAIVTQSHPALGNKVVRRALAYGIDRVAIVRRLLGEVDRRYRPSDSAVLLNTSPRYRPNWSRYRYQPALARRLLEQEGCRRGADRIFVCDGHRLSLRFASASGQPLRAGVLQLAQEHLREAGVELVQAFGTSEGANVRLFAWINYSDSSSRKHIFGCKGDQNLTGYCQRLVTEDLDQADRILDPEQRARVLNRVDRQLARDVPVIPLFQFPLLFAFRSDIRGIEPAPFSPFWNVEDWWLDD
jgi:peptide/nickel transport system substrate-binding protein